MKIIENVGPIDRIVRIAIGIALLALVFVGPHTLWGLFGLVPLATGIWGYCPLYQLLHLERPLHLRRSWKS